MEATMIPAENWFRSLKDDRLEVCLKVGDLRMRASGTEPDIYHLVEEFETLTGIEVHGYWKRPPPSGPRQLDGQVSIFEEPREI